MRDTKQCLFFHAKKCAKHILDVDNNAGAIARLVEILEKKIK